MVKIGDSVYLVETKAQKDEDIKEVINKMINVYKDKEDVKMIKIS